MTIRTSFIASAFALLLTFAPASDLAAQPSDPAIAVQGGAPQWTEVFGEQVRVLLESDDVNRQENAMLLILRYERQTDLDIDFRPAVPALFEIYEGSAEEGHRLLALSTLQAIGGEPVLNRLAERMRENREASDRVKRHTIRVLAAHLQYSRADR